MVEIGKYNYEFLLRGGASGSPIPVKKDWGVQRIRTIEMGPEQEAQEKVSLRTTGNRIRNIF